MSLCEYKINDAIGYDDKVVKHVHLLVYLKTFKFNCLSSNCTSLYTISLYVMANVSTANAIHI